MPAIEYNISKADNQQFQQNQPQNNAITRDEFNSVINDLGTNMNSLKEMIERLQENENRNVKPKQERVETLSSPLFSLKGGTEDGSFKKSR